MKEKNIIILCITLIICTAIISSTIIFLNQNNINNTTTENNTVNITLNNSENTTNETTNNTEQTTKTSTKTSNEKSSSEREYRDYINDEWVSMSEKEYAERYPVLYHEESLREGRYDKYNPELYEVDRENGRI